jgi:hypothetical protein
VSCRESAPSRPICERARFVRVLVGCCVLWLAGCTPDPREIEVPPIGPLYDGAVPIEASIPDGAVLCESDEDCGDGVACTRDLCLADGYCAHAIDSSVCSDGLFCNGLEQCVPTEGCAPTPAPACNDDDVCTIDICDEEGKRCSHEPRDFDGDGEADWHCAGGTDCDDGDATRGALSIEACGDGVDNDCDEQIDESECGVLAHDRCEDALDVSATGTFEVPARGALHDYALACGAENGRDVAFRFELEAPADVVLRARGILRDGSDEVATLALRDDCDDLTTERKCKSGFPSELRMRGLPKGRYFVVAHSLLAERIVLEMALDEPSEREPNDTCEDAIDVGAGGRFESSFVDIGDDTSLRCGVLDAPDLVYTLELSEESDVELAVTSATGERMHAVLRSSCDEASSALRCISDAPALGRIRRVPEGRYFIVVEGPASREVDFSLEVAVLPPTDDPPGEGCASAIDLPLGVSTPGTFAARQDRIDVRCECAECGSFLRDVVYRLEIEETLDLNLQIEGADTRMYYALRDNCEDPTTQTACGDGTPLSDRLRNVSAGTHYLIVESIEATGFTVQADRLEPTIPVEVEGNGACALAADITASGGVFIGDTGLEDPTYEATCGGGASSPDAVFRLVLGQAARVRASLTADFDTVLYRFGGSGGTTNDCLSGADRACDDDSGDGTNSVLEERLDPGTYFYVVDGYGFGNQGPYLFDVSIVP